jgi:hypothetical protein
MDVDATATARACPNIRDCGETGSVDGGGSRDLIRGLRLVGSNLSQLNGGKAIERS